MPQYKNRKDFPVIKDNKQPLREQFNVRREILREHDNSSALNLLSQIDQNDKKNASNNK